MGSRTLDIYAERARLLADDTLASGRTAATRGFEPFILEDARERLQVNPGDRILDIGSGIGLHAIPFSHVAQSVTVVDHADVLARLKSNAPNQKNIDYVPGDILTADLGDRRFTKAIAYSMVHYFESVEDINRMVDIVLAHMEHGGLFLIGDIPNEDYRQRVIATPEGQKTISAWTVRLLQSNPEQQASESVLKEPADRGLVGLGDKEIAEIVCHVRGRGNHAWVYPQSPRLAYNHQREDILIQKLIPAPLRDQFIARAKEKDTGADTMIPLSVRAVEEADCDLIYAWSQEDGVRAASIRQEAFTIEQHREWFAGKMQKVKDGTLKWFMLEENCTIPLGQVRYEKVIKGQPLWTGGPVAENDGGAEVAISIIPQARGMRLARAFLLRTEAQQWDDHKKKWIGHHTAKEGLGVTKLIALIRPENTGSKRAFASAGYRPKGEETRMGVLLERWENDV